MNLQSDNSKENTTNDFKKKLNSEVVDALTKEQEAQDQEAQDEAAQVKIQELSKQESINGKELFEIPIRNIPMLVGDMIPKIGLVSLVGTSDIGKSTFLRQLVFEFVTKKQFFLEKFPIKSTNRKVLFIITEDAPDVVAVHGNKYIDHFKLSAEDFCDVEFMFGSDDILERINDKIQKWKPALVVIDSFEDIMEGQVNDSAKVRKVLSDFSNLIYKHRSCFMILHHTKKSTENLNPSKNNAKGSQSFEAKMRLVIEFRKDSKDADFRHLCIVKGNYLPESEKRSSHVLKMGAALTFSLTGDRTSFDLLGEQENDPQREKAIEVKKMLDAGKLQKDIVKEMGYRSSSSITNMKTKYPDIFKNDVDKNTAWK